MRVNRFAAAFSRAGGRGGIARLIRRGGAPRRQVFLFRLFAAGLSYGDDRDDSAIACTPVFPTARALSEILVANGRR